MSDEIVTNGNEGLPESGPFDRDAQFIEQRLMGGGNIENLAAHRRSQLQAFRRCQIALRDTAPVDEGQDLGNAPVALESGSRPGVINALNWSPLGPAASLKGQAVGKPPVSGRIEAIAISDDGNRVYLGSANGGIWRSDDAGEHWVPTMNAFNLQPNSLQADSLSVGALAIDPANPDRVYVGTGEGGAASFKPASSASGSGYFGVGPAISDDGGLTWMNEALKPAPTDNGGAFYPMAVDPLRPERVVAPTSNGLYVREPRNENIFPATGYQPQSYLYRYTPVTGETYTGYWNQNITDIDQAINFGANNSLQNFDVLVPFMLTGQPYFIFYNSGNGDFILSRFLGSGFRTKVNNGAWAAGLSLAPFQLNGLPHLVRYNPANGQASVLAWNEDGSTTEVQNALVWPTNLTLQPIVIEGFPYIVGYNATNGSVTVLQWNADATTRTVTGLPAGTWPNGASLAGFELNDMQYLLRYVPANGTYAVEQIQNDLSFTTLVDVGIGSLQIWPINLVLNPLVFDDDPYLLTYAPANGSTTLYSWNALAVPQRQWTAVWDNNLILMPFLMGFQWIQKTAPNKNATDEATSVVVSSNGLVTTFFAAFFDGPVFKSVDKGNTWTQIGGDPGFTQRISLAVQPNNADLLYAIDKLGKVWRLDTTNVANTWKLISGTPPQDELVGPQGNYDLVIAVLPSDPDVFFIGGSTKLIPNVTYAAAIYRGKVNVCSGPLSIDSPTGKMDFIGASCHADVHAMTFNPAMANGLWVGCDGGAFFASDIMDDNLDTIFESKNAGVNTMTLERMGQHPNYDAVLFAGSQDNGCQRYLGDPAWTVVSTGDSGAVVVNRGDTTKVVCSYVRNTLFLSTSSGGPGTFNTNVSVPNPTTKMDQTQVLFYAPLVNPPATSGQPNYLAFGANRPYLSKDFGSSWSSLPKNNNTDVLPSLVRSLSFASTSTILYVGTLGGQVYRLTKGLLSWSREQIDATGQPDGLPAAAPITGIAVMPGEDKSIYISYGGQLPGGVGWQRVWFYNGTTKKWEARSGPGAGNSAALLNVQYNTIVTGATGNDLFAGADIGVWESTDAGANWAPMGNGLPEAAVLDLGYFPANTTTAQPALLRASTYGRGMYEWVLSTDAKFRKPVQLYIRDTILDRGLYPTVDGLKSPVNPSQKVNHRNGPDIKAIQEVAPGIFGIPGQITFLTFSDGLDDKSQDLTRQEETRMYVQIHQRGVLDAENTAVKFLLSTNFSAQPPTTQPTATNPNPAPTPPVLPDNLANLLRNGTPITPPVANNPGWFDLGSDTIPNLVAGVPRVKSVDIPALRIPTAGVYCFLAIASNPLDRFSSDETNADLLAVADPKVAIKYLIVK